MQHHALPRYHRDPAVGIDSEPGTLLRELEEGNQEVDSVRNDAKGGDKQRPEVEAVPALEGREDEEDELERIVEGEGRADNRDDGARRQSSPYVVLGGPILLPGFVQRGSLDKASGGVAIFCIFYSPSDICERVI
jgi:hypothetical protein